MAIFRKTLSLPDERATTELGKKLAMRCRAGDFIALSGELGAGKTSLARAMIRRLVRSDIKVPSPSYMLMQTYDSVDFPIWHIDLYRLEHPYQLYELGLEDSGAALLLLEWPERGQDCLDAPSLRVAMSHAGRGRTASLSGDERWRDCA